MATRSRETAKAYARLSLRSDNIRLELVYENGDYSMQTVQGFHLLQNGNGSREVRLVRGASSRMRFPRLP